MRRHRAWLSLGLALLMLPMGCAPGDPVTTMTVPLKAGADAGDVTSLQTWLRDDSRVSSCDYRIEDVARDETEIVMDGTARDAWLALTFEPALDRADLQQFVDRIESDPAFSRTVAGPAGTQWWSEH